MGNLCASDKAVEGGCRASGCHDFLMKLEKGTIRRGRRRRPLSAASASRGGLRPSHAQRCAHRDPDEATAYTFPKTRTSFRPPWQGWFGERTLFVIAHRLSPSCNSTPLWSSKTATSRRRAPRAALEGCALYATLWPGDGCQDEGEEGNAEHLSQFFNFSGDQKGRFYRRSSTFLSFVFEAFRISAIAAVLTRGWGNVTGRTALVKPGFMVLASRAALSRRPGHHGADRGGLLVCATSAWRSASGSIHAMGFSTQTTG
jgi:hypothetical protein